MNHRDQPQNGATADAVNQKEKSNVLFPFAAVVNQEKAKEALLLALTGCTGGPVFRRKRHRQNNSGSQFGDAAA